MAPSTASILAALQFNRKSRLWSCGWHGRTPAGTMIAWSERWPIWVIQYRIRQWETFCAATESHRHPSEAKPLHGRISSLRTERSGGRRFLHGGSAYLARTGYLLCAVLPSSGNPPGQRGRNHAPYGSGVDGADRSQRDTGSLGATFIRAALCCTIATPSSAHPFGRCWWPAE